MKKIAISIGDPNGVGLEIILNSHAEISKICEPIYCVHHTLLERAAQILRQELPKGMRTYPSGEVCFIRPGKVDRESGHYSYRSFLSAIELCEHKEADALVTLPIHKEAWSLAGIEHKGHTDMLREHFKQDAIMMLGCERMYVALFTEHIPLKEVAARVDTHSLYDFLMAFAPNANRESVAVLGLNPHAGDNGVLGNEERMIEEAISHANRMLGYNAFVGPMVPDIAFTPRVREKYRYFIAMYHDQGLAPLKALYFDEGINVSLNLPIVRTSVDHGTAFDIAYKNIASNLSYLNAIKSALAQIDKRNL